MEIAGKVWKVQNTFWKYLIHLKSRPVKLFWVEEERWAVSHRFSSDFWQWKWNIHVTASSRRPEMRRSLRWCVIAFSKAVGGAIRSKIKQKSDGSATRGNTGITSVFLKRITRSQGDNNAANILRGKTKPLSFHATNLWPENWTCEHGHFLFM